MRLRVRSSLLAWWLVASSVVVIGGFGAIRADAACVMGKIPTVEVTGIATAAGQANGSGYPSYTVDLRSDDGVIHRIQFGGRDPKQPNLWVEDSYTGELPAVGGRYRIVGATFADSGGLITLNGCVPQAEVTMLSPPPVIAKVKPEPSRTPVAIGAGAVAVSAGVGVVLARRRRLGRQRGD
jgi:hypothetical protein